MPSSEKDSLFAEPLKRVADFRFDEHVARVFPDMISRSVPGYETILSAISLFSAIYARPTSLLYDLGCSLGAATLAVARGCRHKNCRIIAVDNSREMIKSCRSHLQKERPALPVDMVCADIRDVRINSASFVVLNFTLQFIPEQDRTTLLKKIYQGMLPGGALVLSEKLAFEDDQDQRLLYDLHLAFKKAHGYSDLEISQKRSALEKVLIPETWAAHKSRLQAAGFRQSALWFRYFNFASMVAIK